MYDDDGEPDFTLDELEWQEMYPELCNYDPRAELDEEIDNVCPHCSGTALSPYPDDGGSCHIVSADGYHNEHHHPE